MILHEKEVVAMGWRWPGRGPWSWLPPWLRPGWWFGRGLCWWLLFGPPAYALTPADELKVLEDYKRILESELRELERRIEELKRELEKGS